MQSAEDGSSTSSSLNTSCHRSRRGAFTTTQNRQRGIARNRWIASGSTSLSFASEAVTSSEIRELCLTSCGKGGGRRRKERMLSSENRWTGQLAARKDVRS